MPVDEPSWSPCWYQLRTARTRAGLTLRELAAQAGTSHSTLRVVRRPFAGAELPVLSCQDLAIFKAFFDRTKNRADLEAMAAAGVLDVAAVTGVLVEYLGPDDPRIERVVEVARAGAASDADSWVTEQ